MDSSQASFCELDRREFFSPQPSRGFGDGQIMKLLVVHNRLFLLMAHRVEGGRRLIFASYHFT